MIDNRRLDGDLPQRVGDNLGLLLGELPLPPMALPIVLRLFLLLLLLLPPKQRRDGLLCCWFVYLGDRRGDVGGSWTVLSLL